jgi:DNA-binding LacI/PurR family transcriptional regulator
MNTIWLRIYSSLKSDILAGKYAKGERFYSVLGLADAYDVSTATSRRVLSELCNSRLVVSTRKKGSYIQYSGKKCEVFLLAPEKMMIAHDNIIISKIMKGIFLQAEAKGIKVTLITENFFTSSLVSEVTKNQPIMLHIYGTHRFAPEILVHKACGCDLIMIHTPDSISGTDTVRTDICAAIFTSVKHLAELRHKRIAFISGEFKSLWFYKKFEGYQKGLIDSSLSLDLRMVKELPVIDIKNTVQAMKELMALKEPPTAIVAATDIIALQIMDYCRECGIRLPEDLSLSGYDNDYEAEHASTGLTTLDPKLELLGKTAIDMSEARLNKNISKTMDSVITAEYIIRDSTRKLED